MQSSDESDDNEKNGVPTNRGSDTEPDEVAKETPEEEVGELPIMEKKKSHLLVLPYISKSEWQKNGLLLFMAFSNHAPLLMSLKVDVAMNLSVLHHSARERGQFPGLLDVILIREIGIQQVICTSMLKIAGEKKTLVGPLRSKENLALKTSVKAFRAPKSLTDQSPLPLREKGKALLPFQHGNTLIWKRGQFTIILYIYIYITYRCQGRVCSLGCRKHAKYANCR